MSFRPFPLLLALSALSAGEVPIVVPPGTPADGSGDRPLMVIVDQSMSMRSNDPDRFTVDSVQLAVASIRDGKRLGIIGFGSKVKKLVPWKVIGSHSDRFTTRDLLSEEIEFNGSDTKYVLALEAAWTELDAIKAPAGAHVLMFTDGNADDPLKKIEAAAARFKERGWVIDGLRLNVAKEEAPDLAAVCRVTLGAYSEATKAEDLVETFMRLASAENDIFILDTVKVDPQQAVPVLPGCERLFYCAVKNKRKTEVGRIRDLSVDGRPISLIDPRIYRYPKAEEARTSNIDLLNIVNPEVGTYTASFEGQPRSVYVSLSFPVRIEPYPLPSQVAEGDTLKLGVSLVPTKDDPRLSEFLAKETAVSAVVKDAQTGREMAKLDLTPEALAKGTGHQGPYIVNWPDPLPRQGVRQYLVNYDVRLRGVWKLPKLDSFNVAPLQRPPPPGLKFGTPEEGGTGKGQTTLTTWVGLPTQRELPFEITTGTPKGSLSFAGRDGFTFPKPIELGRDQTVLAQFQHDKPGRHGGTFLASLDKLPLPTGNLTISAGNYPWAGKEAIELAGDGETGLVKWSPGHPDLVEQPLQAMTVHLADADGRKADLVIDASGFARLMAGPGLSDTVLTGTGVIHFGKLPERQVRVTYRYVKPRVASDWNAGRIDGRLEAGPNTVLPAQTFTQTGGEPGAVKVQVTDLVGPDGEKLLPEYDVRVQAAPEQAAPGTPIAITLTLIRGEDLKPGVYHGQVVVTHTTATGGTTTFSRPIAITVP